MKSWLQTPQGPAWDLQEFLPSGTTLKTHLKQHHSELEGEKTSQFSPNKGKCLKNAGNSTLA